MSKTLTIVLCASVAFYKHLNQLAGELTALGFHVVVPETATIMAATNTYDAAAVRTWYQNPADFHLKGALIHSHFDKIEQSDMILVINDEKHGTPGYIGPNVLMEMGLAFYLRKPIYVLNPINKDMPMYEEVLGMGATILDGDISRISL